MDLDEFAAAESLNGLDITIVVLTRARGAERGAEKGRAPNWGSALRALGETETDL
jgi:hypothetical protein